jgi:outer membrane murein-binding lipoprotein Lpp
MKNSIYLFIAAAFIWASITLAGCVTHKQELLIIKNLDAVSGATRTK